MKFVVEQQQMANVLSHITSILENTQTRDILSHAHIRVGESGELDIGCTSVNVTLLAKLQLQNVTETGNASIPGKRLFEIFRNIPPSAQVEFETVEDMVSVAFNRVRYTLNVMSGSDENVLDFGMREAPEDQVTVNIRAGLLESMLQYTNPIMGRQESRQYMVATCFEIGKEYFKLISTEATVLGSAMTTESTNSGLQEDEELRQFVVPRKTVTKITELLSGVDKDRDVSVVLGTNYLSVELEPFNIISSLVDTQFPDYNRVFPDPADWMLRCGRDELRMALQQIDVVATDSSHRASCDVADDILKLASSSTRNDRVNNEIAVEGLTAERKFSINVEKMLRVLQALRTPRIAVSTSAENERANLVVKGVGQAGDEETEDSPPEPIEVAYVVALLYNQ